MPNPDIDALDTQSLQRDSLAAAGRPTQPSQPAPQARVAGAAPSLHLILPARPTTVEETGLDLEAIEELALKAVVAAGSLDGGELATRLRLPLAGVVEEAVTALRRDGLLDNAGVNQAMLGAAGMKLRPTERGHQIERRIRERDGYVGPAPVSRSAFKRMLRQQAMAGRTVKRADVWRHLAHLLLPDATIDRIGAGIEAGGPILLHGPSGNGKTSVALALARMFSAGVLVPYAVEMDGHVVRVFDPGLHRPLPPDALPPDALPPGLRLDDRWVYCQTPCVRLGPDLQPAELDLTLNEQHRYYETPLQLKAAGGVLLVDDLDPRSPAAEALVNRILEPLATGVDYLSTVTGRRIVIPFTPFVVFATAADPSQLFGEPTLRRLPCKIRLDDPTDEQFSELLRRACAQAGVALTPSGQQYLVERCYAGGGRARRACHPAELARLIAAAARYLGVPPALTPQLVDIAADQYFG